MSGGVLFENRWEIILMRKIFAAAIFSAVLMISGMAAASEAEAVKLLNELRAEVGLPALAWDSQSKLQRAAEVRARELEEKFSHTRPDGTACFTALDEFGVRYMACAENIAYGTNLDAAGVIELWRNSPGHYANMTNGGLRKVGLASYRAGDNVYWVQLFTD